MKPAVSTLVLYTKREEKLLDLVDGSGEVRYWEIVDEGYNGLNEERIKGLKDIASTRDIRYAVHAPLSLTNIAVADEWLRDKIVNYLLSSLERSYRLGAEVWVVHPGQSTPFTYYFPEEASKAQRESLEELSKASMDRGITLALENLSSEYALFRRVEEGRRAIEGLDYATICLDVGHANLTGTMKDWIENIEDVGHIHIHDNHGSKDDHLALGQGIIDWNPLMEGLRRVNYQGWLVAENHELSLSLESLRVLGLLSRP
jgi:sugar phosphate isomerase/epimerase